MPKRQGKPRSAIHPGLRAGALLLLLAAAALSQNPAPASPPPALVEAGGYALKTAGGIERNTWATETPRILWFNFSIDRPVDHNPFSSLQYDQIVATVDGAPIPIREADLKSSAAGTANVVLVIDGSGSMNVGSRNGTDKLSAAKDAIGDFLRLMRKDDQIAVLYFNEKAYILSELTKDKAAVQQAVNDFHISGVASEHTALYESMKSAVLYAQKVNAKHVVFLTDGIEDTIDFNRLSAPDKVTFKTGMETDIATLAQPSGIHVWSIGLGDRNSPGTELYVDEATLTSISSRTNAGNCNYIDLPSLANLKSNSQLYHDALVDKLKGILAGIDKAIHFDYQLRLHPGNPYVQPDGALHKVRVESRLPYQDQIEVLPIEFTYEWDKNTAAPTVNPIKVLEKEFIRLKPGEKPQDLLGIYMKLATLLGLLALIPVLLQLLRKRRLGAIADSSVISVRNGSPHIGRPCPMTRHVPARYIQAGDSVVVCPKCGTPQHLDCWHLNHDRCWIRTCGEHLAIRQEVLESYGVSA